MREKGGKAEARGAQKKGGREGGKEGGKGRSRGRVKRWRACQESDAALIGSVGHCERRRSVTGRAVRMIAHLSAQKTNKNKPLLI